MRSAVRWLLMFCFMPAFALCATDAADSRAAQIQRAREQRARTLTPEKVNRVHRMVYYVESRGFVNRFSTGVAGFRPLLGGLGPGSGFAVGIEYFRPDLRENRLRLRTSLSGSTRAFYLAGIQLIMPRLAGSKLLLDWHARSGRAPSVDYYGPGPGSQITGRTAYSLEEAAFGLRAAYRPFRKTTIGTLGRFIGVEVGSGRDSKFAQTREVFPPASAPGINEQPWFFQSGVFAEYDSREPGGTRSGTTGTAQYSAFSDFTLGRYSFHRLDLEARRFVAFLNDRRAFAFRIRTSLSAASDGNTVPFYMQPELGGADSLRGFRARRFYGNHALLMTGEYRWEIFSRAHAAVFADAGRVFNDLGQFSLRGLEKSAGFGFRLGQPDFSWWRMDVAFGREGPQFWLTFNNIF